MRKYSLVTSNFLNAACVGLIISGERNVGSMWRWRKAGNSLLRKWDIQSIGEAEALLECIEYLMAVYYELK